MKHKIISAATFVAAVLLGAGPSTIFKVCEVTAEKIMKCHWTAMAMIPVALVLGAAALLQFFAKDLGCKKALGIVACTALIGAILLPSVLIGGCMKPEMPCNMLSFPCIYGISAAGLILQIIGLLDKGAASR